MLIRRFLLAAVVLGALAGCEDLWVRTGGVGTTTDRTTTERTATGHAGAPSADALADRMIALFPCASADWSPGNPHQMSYGLNKHGGWAKYMEGPVTEAVERFGYKRVMFHLPFGKTTGQSPRAVKQRETGRDDASLEAWHMSMDHVHDLQRTGNLWIADEFYAALRRLHARHPDVEVIVYLGSWDGEDAALAKSKGVDAVMQRWHESVDPLVELDYVSLVFDAAVTMPKDHPNARFVQWAAEQKRAQPGRFVGVEARIQKGNPWPNELCLTDVAWEDVWRKQAHAGNIPADQLCGPVIRVIDGRARSLIPTADQSDPGAWIKLAADIARDGHDPAVSTMPGRAMRAGALRLPTGRSVPLPSSTREGPFRMPADTLAELIEAEVSAD